MHALVTGATGFVGSHLVEELLQRGHKVRCTVRSTSKLRWLEGKPVELAKADLSDAASLPAAAKGVDTVFHVAGLLRGDTWEEYRAGNWKTTHNLLEATAPGTRFIFVSSLAACGPAPTFVPLTEEFTCAPISQYGKSKWEAEQEVWSRRDSLAVTVVRPPVVYGTRDEGLLDLYQALNHGIRPEIGGPKHVSLVHVRDLARGLVDAAAPAGKGHVFFICNRDPQTFGNLMELILKALDKRAVTVPVPDRVLRLLGGIVEDATRLIGKGGLFTRDKALEMTQKYWICSPQKAETVLGWKANVGLEDGFKETLSWYREQKLI